MPCGPRSCFFVPTSGRYVPPYESAFLGYDRAKPGRFGKLNGAPAGHVRSCWERTGFDPGKLTIFEPLRASFLPDHVGLEMAFMAFLCRAEKSAGKNF